MDKKTDAVGLGKRFVDALAANQPAGYEQVFDEDVTLRVYGWQGHEVRRPRFLVSEWLMREWSAWADPHVILLSEIETAARVAVEFRIQATENNRYVEHNRAAFLEINNDKIQTIDLYCAEPIPSARRSGYTAPASLSAAAIRRLMDTKTFQFDSRHGVPRHLRGSMNLRLVQTKGEDAHPSSNFIFAVHWPAAETDAGIKAIIEHHRQKGIGFTWQVGPFDSPSDLGQRLEAHGMVLAGDQSNMARIGLDDLRIAANLEVLVRPLNNMDEEEVEAAYTILTKSFHWNEEQIENRRSFFGERLRNPVHQDREKIYLAWLDGRPVAFAQLSLGGSTAFLSGAATLPECRGKRIYSTLLKHRLEVAREFGHQVATIDAQPMSRPIVARFGFEEYARSYLYAWMPEIDMEVIQALIPSD